MSKKKKSFFGKIKDKFKRSEEEYEDFEDGQEEYEEVEYEEVDSDDEGYEEVELDEKTSEEISALPKELQAHLKNEAAHTEDDSQQELEDEDDEDEVQFEAMSLNDDDKDQLDAEIEDKTDPNIEIPDVSTIAEDAAEEEDDIEALLTQEKEEITREINLQEMQAQNSLEDEQEDEIEEDDDDDDTDVDFNELNEFQIPSKSKVAKFKESFSNLRTNIFAKASEGKEKSKSKFGSFNSSGVGIKNWDDLIQKVFNPDSRATIHKFAILGIMTSLTYTGGKLIGQAVSEYATPKTKQSRSASAAASSRKNWNKDIKAIETANIFNAKRNETDKGEVKPTPKVEEIKICHEATKKTSLPIKIVNTIVLQDSVKSVASVQVRGRKKLHDIREGEKLENIAEIGKIERQKVILKNLQNRQCEFIENVDKKLQRLAKKNPIKVVSKEQGKKLLNKIKDTRIRNEGNSFKIKKAVRDEMLSNISEVLTQARAVQIKNPDGTLAFKMTEIVPGSIYSQLSIQDGDIITGINGKTFSNLNEIMTLFGKLKDTDQYEITVKRGGVEQTLQYNFD